MSHRIARFPRLVRTLPYPLLAGLLVTSPSCNNDDSADGGGTESSSSGGAAENSADLTGVGPCETGIQPAGQCIEEIDFGDKAILEVRVGFFSNDGRESIATQTVQSLNMGRLYATPDGTFVHEEGPSLTLSAPWELVVGRFHAGLDVDELLYIEPNFENFHFFRATNPGLSLMLSEPSGAGAIGQNALGYDANSDGIDEVYEVSLTGSARLLQGTGGMWSAAGNYTFTGGPLGDAGVVVDLDGDGVEELVAPLAGNTAGSYDAAVHKFAVYSGTAGMLVVDGQYEAGDKPFWIDAGDFDGDSVADILVKGDDVGVLLSTPFGLGAHNSLMLGGGVASRARACDINGDGIHEVVTMPTASGGGLLVWSNVLATPAIETVAMVTAPQELECPDLDGDGRDDIVFRDDTDLRVLRPIPGT
jgi:hypothetical protein